MIDLIGSVIPILFESPSLPLALVVYTYLLYIAFFKKGKFILIESLDEMGRLIILFIGLSILTISIIVGIIFLSSILFGTTLPKELFFNWQDVILPLLAFIFIPYLFKKESEKKHRKFDLGDWFFIILVFDLGLIIFSLINAIYAKIFVTAEVSSFFMITSLFLGFSFLLSVAYLHAVLIPMLKLREQKYFNKKGLKICIFQIFISIIAICIYLLYKL
ncbi:MAG: hypothetical protein Q7S55_04590 [Nanoarchaeota archaeon]|nr:hypothetical protein [Nanoarchaeota archaeon]